MPKDAPFHRGGTSTTFGEKAKREANRLLTASDTEAAKQDKIKQAEATMHAQNATVIATFAERAKDARIAAGASAEDAKVTGKAAAAEAETSFADTTTMQE
jgi:hypothetical protein